MLQRKYKILDDQICGIVAGLIKIPETVKRAIFVRSRLKDILVSYYHEAIGQQIAKIVLNQKVRVVFVTIFLSFRIMWSN